MKILGVAASPFSPTRGLECSELPSAVWGQTTYPTAFWGSRFFRGRKDHPEDSLPLAGRVKVNWYIMQYILANYEQIWVKFCGRWRWMAQETLRWQLASLSSVTAPGCRSLNRFVDMFKKTDWLHIGGNRDNYLDSWTFDLHYGPDTSTRFFIK